MSLTSLTIKKKYYNLILLNLKNSKLYLCVTKNYKIIKDLPEEIFSIKKIYFYFFKFFFLFKNSDKITLKKNKGNSLYFLEVNDKINLDIYFLKNKSFNFLFFILYKSYFNYFCLYLYKFKSKINLNLSYVVNYLYKFTINLFYIFMAIYRINFNILNFLINN